MVTVTISFPKLSGGTVITFLKTKNYIRNFELNGETVLCFMISLYALSLKVGFG